MTGGEVLGWFSLAVTGLLGLLVFITNRRANRTSEKKVSAEEEDMIAARRLEELKRLYPNLDKLEEEVRRLRADVETLKASEQLALSQASTVKSIVKRWFYVLIDWDLRGRYGQMPLPTTADMELLEIDFVPLNTQGEPQ